MNLQKIGISKKDEWQVWVILFIVIITTVILFPPNHLIFKKLSVYVIHWMLLLLFGGLFFLINGVNRLLYFCFGATGIICLFLMNSFNSKLKDIDISNSEGGVTVLFANPSLSNDNYNNTMKAIAIANVDIILLEEITPDWLDLLADLKKLYHYSVIYAQSDYSGKAILSKIPLINPDTIYTNTNSILGAKFVFDLTDSFDLYVCTSLPPLVMNDYNKLNLYLNQLSSIILNTKNSVFVGSNFNIVPWSSELMNFKNITNLQGSRRDNSQSHLNNSFFGIFNTPKSEILYSNKLDCSFFNIIKDSQSNPFGIFGRYHKKSQ